MSHELRTPLNAIIGYSEMLKDEAVESGNKQHITDLSKISNAGNHLLNLINSILDLTKIEAGKTEIEYQRVNINTLSSDIITTIKPLINKGDNILIVDYRDDLGSYCIDQTKVKQILFNLLSNASKFTKNGTITYSVTTEHLNENDWLCFTITDTGIGIASDKLDQLFMPFVQADISTTRLYGGTGLGLTISKHFVTLMGGIINVESTLGKGTVFTVKLPVNDGQCNS
jgi:signal transduction histidine kinase